MIESVPTPEKVTNLFKTSSKYDVVLKGQVVRLKLDPCRCGVHAMWVIDVPLHVMMPAELRGIMPETDKKVTKVIDDWHYHPRSVESRYEWQKKFWLFWETKVLKQTLEKELKKWIDETRGNLLGIQKSEDNMDKLWESL